MQVIIRPRGKFPNWIKRKICECVTKNRTGISSYYFRLHFNIMRPVAKHFVGYVDTWSEWRTKRYKEVNKRRRYFVVKVIEW